FRCIACAFLCVEGGERKSQHSAQQFCPGHVVFLTNSTGIMTIDANFRRGGIIVARTSREQSSLSGLAILAYGFLLFAILFLAWRLWPVGTQTPGSDPTARSRPIAAAGPETSEEKTRIEVFSKAKASVVNISSGQLRRDLSTM